MPSRINSTTTSPGGLISTGDSDNSLLIQTGDTTAITISSTQQVTLTNPLPVGSGGTGGTTGLTALNASNLTSGTVPDARFPATLPAASGANLASLNASSISSGTVGTARLASGTADATTFLRGDQTWAPAGSTVNVQTFSSSGTWTKPSTGTMCAVLVIGGGGGGGRATGGYVGGGGGGAIASAIYRLSDLGSTVTVTIGSGGSGAPNFTTAGGNGSITRFGSQLAVIGGLGGTSFDNTNTYTPPARTNTVSASDTNAFVLAGGLARFTNNDSLWENGAIPADGGNGGTGSGYSTSPVQAQFGTGGAGSQGGSGSTGTGSGAGGGSGNSGAGAGTAGLCRVVVW